MSNATETIISFFFKIITKRVIFNDKYCMIDYWTENYENRCISDGNVLKISGMFCFLSTYVIRLHTIKVNNRYMQWFWFCFGLQTTCKYYHFPYQILTYDLTLNTISKPIRNPVTECFQFMWYIFISSWFQSLIYTIIQLTSNSSTF